MPRPAPVNRRENILAAARAEFDARGYAGARMEEIARGVGISRAALYLQFESKEAIFRELVEGLTRWSDWVGLRGELERQGLRLVAEHRTPGGLHRWTMR